MKLRILCRQFLAATLEIRDSLMEVRGWKECEIGRKVRTNPPVFEALADDPSTISYNFSQLYEWTKQDAIDELFNTIVDWVSRDDVQIIYSEGKLTRQPTRSIWMLRRWRTSWSYIRDAIPDSMN